jgi:hypothetical protein
MSRAVPTKPPVRPFQPAYAVTTTTRVPGRPGPAERPDEGERHRGDPASGAASA